MNVYVCECVCICMYVCRCVCMCEFACMCVGVCVYVYVQDSRFKMFYLSHTHTGCAVK